LTVIPTSVRWTKARRSKARRTEARQEEVKSPPREIRRPPSDDARSFQFKQFTSLAFDTCFYWTVRQSRMYWDWSL